MSKGGDIYKNLVTLLKLFKNRPYHLAKFLLDKDALDKKFSKEIQSSTKLLELDQKPVELNPDFNNITKMNDYFQNLLENNHSELQTPAELERDLNTQLDRLIKEEKYEEAACLRDYMMEKNFKRKSKFR